jgi:hypothetical protein
MILVTGGSGANVLSSGYRFLLLCESSKKEAWRQFRLAWQSFPPKEAFVYVPEFLILLKYYPNFFLQFQNPLLREIPVQVQVKV